MKKKFFWPCLSPENSPHPNPLPVGEGVRFSLFFVLAGRYVCFFLLISCNICLLSSCKNTKETAPPAQHEIGKKLIGTWRLLYTDTTVKDHLPPSDLTYIISEDQKIILTYTDQENKKQKIERTYKLFGDHLQCFNGESITKEFQLAFPDNNTLRLTEKETKISLVLERIRE